MNESNNKYNNNISLQDTNFLNGKNQPIRVSDSSLEMAKTIISSAQQSPPSIKSKRGRNDDDDNDKSNIQQLQQIDNSKNKLNKFDEKSSTGFKTANNQPIRVAKEIFNKEKSKIDIELQNEIDLNKYQGDIALLEQPLVKDDNNNTSTNL